jgi:hypothetical protein
LRAVLIGVAVAAAGTVGRFDVGEHQASIGASEFAELLRGKKLPNGSGSGSLTQLRKIRPPVSTGHGWW